MSLKISYDELRREIGRHLGFSRTPADWDANEVQDVADILRGGLRQFYWPPAVEGGSAHRWSFLCIVAEIELVSGTRIYDLPGDFVRVCSPFTYSYSDGKGSIATTDEREIRSLYSAKAIQGIPQYCAIRSRASALEEGYEVLFYPEPDSAMTVTYRYERLPEELDDSNQFHLGPAVHSELILSSCLMVADKMLNQESIAADGGTHAQRFFRQLPTSISIDKQSLGTGN